jgi:dipeptidyl aminopeptidase/acylaminoacyl peptidase
MTTRVLCLFAISLSCLQAAARFTIEQVMSSPFASSLIAAPQGKAVAWVENESGHRNIYMAAAPDWKARKVTAFDKDDGQQIDELCWAPGAAYLVFARGGDFENDGTNPNPDLSLSTPEQAVWRVALDGKPPQKLAEGRAPAVSPDGQIIAFLRAGQIWTMSPDGTNVSQALQQKWPSEELTWSPRGADLAFVSDRGDHSFIGVYNPAAKTVVYLDPSTDKDSEPAWSPDGTRLAHLRIPATRRIVRGPRREGEPWSIRVVDLRNQSAAQVFRAATGPGSVFHYLEADRQILWTAADRLVFPWERTGWSHLYSIPAAGGNPVELTPGAGIVEFVSLGLDRRTIYFAGNFNDIDRRHIWRVDDSASQPMHEVTPGNNIEWAPAAVAGSDALAFLASSYNQTAHAVIRQNSNSKPLAPETVPADFPETALVRPQPVIITASDGLEIHAQLFLPPAATNASPRHPALIFFHGGSRRQMLLGFHYMYYYSNAYSLNQYLANHGYVVLSVNYRSGIGYGLNFREAINYGAAGASEFHDVVGAGLYLKSRPDVDPKRIGVWGGSYGGYLTALALSRASDLFAAGVDFHGVHDWSTLFEGVPANLDPPEQRQLDQAKRVAFESSPLASVATWKSPVLLIQGDDDRNVPFSQSVRLAEALRKEHVYFEELILPNEIHDFLMHRSWVRAYQATAGFFQRTMRASAATAAPNSPSARPAAPLQ